MTTDAGPAMLQHELLGLLRDALQHDGFVVHAQPIVDLLSGEPRAHELTLHIAARDGPLISPATYGPVAERFGLMTKLDDLLIRHAVELAGEGHAVAVDVHTASLADPDLGRRAQQALGDGHADPGLLTFELSADALTSNVPAASAFVHRLHDAGCSITVDHFGTGASDFGYLKRLALDRLKIDATFIEQLQSTPSDEQFVRAFVRLAQGLQISTGAEGVIDAATRSLLVDAEVDQGQGALFGAPVALSRHGGAQLTPPRGVRNKR
jgi:EAL domain-containing protein (putative c-di-GMP-specific phosphodiesterase class I)